MDNIVMLVYSFHSMRFHAALFNYSVLQPFIFLYIFIQVCKYVNTLLYHCIVQKVPQSFHGGKFLSAQELDVYERMWHEHIFTACYSNIHEEV